MLNRNRPIIFLLFPLLLSACSDPAPETDKPLIPLADNAADSVYINGDIYTVDDSLSRAQAVAIKDGKFIQVGTNEQVQGLIGENTSVLDLEGRLVIPGMFDSHLHPLGGMAQQLFQCNFPFQGTLETAVAAVGKCAEEHPDWSWITGGQWNAAVLAETSPGKQMLDAVVSDRPVYLRDATYHHGWVNSKALEMAGITAETADPPGGRIVRDPVTGEPTGTLLETATRLVEAIIPEFDNTQFIEAAVAIQQQMNAYGFTGMKSASTTREHLQALHQLDTENRLTLRIGAHLSYIHTAADPQRAAALESIIADRENYSGRLLRTDFIKIMLDGVPPSYTAAYLEPYADRPEHKGEIMMPQDELDAATIRFDAMGLTIKYHAAGDAAARAAIDAIEAARKANGASDQRHEIGHASLMHADDIARLASLNGVAEVSPILWYPSAFVEEGHYMIGAERLERLWPVKPYIDAGILTVAGSDWPAAVASANPWPAIEALISRTNPYGDMPGEVLGAENAVNLETAIRMYTRNGAIAMKAGEIAGSIEPGKSADMIVLEQNLFEIPVEAISETRVVMTVFEGKTVFQGDE